MTSRSYSELILLPTFQERFEYCLLDNVIGERTFGSNRYLNQAFYRSNEWKRFRRDIIIRDNGCDLGIDEHPIGGAIYIHHLNPLTERDFFDRRSVILDPENVICVSNETHRAIHYGDLSRTPQEYEPRSPNDTAPWRLSHG